MKYSSQDFAEKLFIHVGEKVGSFLIFVLHWDLRLRSCTEPEDILWGVTRTCGM